MSRYAGDPRWLVTRYRGECAGCGVALPKGERAFYWPNGKRLECSSCGEASSREFAAAAADEAFLSGGAW